jgi:predicted porin
MLDRVLAGSLALFCFTAHAQSVQIYGIADTSIEYLTNVNAARDHMSRMPTLPGLAPSRLGFRSTEDLGDGFSRQDVTDSPDDANMYIARLVYWLSKRTALYTMAGHVTNSTQSAVALSAGGTVGTGTSQSGIAAAFITSSSVV